MSDEKQELSVNGRQAVSGNGQGRATESGQRGGRGSSAADERSMLPRVDVLEDGSGITLLADMPGVSRENLDLKVDGATLLIEGKVSAPAPQEMEAIYVEIRVPRFRRAFTLSRELDPSRIEANLKDGVLKLRIPKQEHARPRRIEVAVS